MNGVFEAVALTAGLALVAATLWSAMLTVVVPRSERPWITRWHFAFLTSVANWVASRIENPTRRDHFMSRLAPFALVSLSFVWAAHITVGFTLVFWGLGVQGFTEAFVLSGSSITTLGIRDADSVVVLVGTIAEALIGLGITGLMISYLPTIYDAYTAREVAVARLEVRAGRPPHPLPFLVRSFEIGWLEQMDLVWAEWEQWFLQIEETHTTHLSLSYFRSAYDGRSWLLAAGTVLDAAALIESTIDIESSPRAALCIRSGFTTLDRIADALGLDHPTDPHWPDQSVSLDRPTFDRLCRELDRRGIPLVDDLDQAWVDFAGWRVNYDASLLGLLDELNFDAGAWFGENLVTTNGR